MTNSYGIRQHSCRGLGISKAKRVTLGCTVLGGDDPIQACSDNTTQRDPIKVHTLACQKRLTSLDGTLHFPIP